MPNPSELERERFACQSSATHAGVVQPQHAALYEDNLRLMRENAELRDRAAACPCHHTTPCDPDCTCVSPFSSRGCDRCCTYGSPEQQEKRAAYLASLVYRIGALEGELAAYDPGRRPIPARRVAPGVLAGPVILTMPEC